MLNICQEQYGHDLQGVFSDSLCRGLAAHGRHTRGAWRRSKEHGQQVQHTQHAQHGLATRRRTELLFLKGGGAPLEAPPVMLSAALASASGARGAGAALAVCLATFCGALEPAVDLLAAVDLVACTPAFPRRSRKRLASCDAFFASSLRSCPSCFTGELRVILM